MLEKKRVLWFTGLSGAGKSTLAERVYKHLEKMDFKVVIVDGDKIRSESHINLDFSPQGIIKNNKLVIDLCLEYLHTYECIIVSVIAPFASIRKMARESLGGAYVEIYVKASLETVIKRDTKGLYSRTQSNNVNYLIGVDPKVPYQEPENPDIVINTDSLNEDQSVKILLNNLMRLN